MVKHLVIHNYVELSETDPKLENFTNRRNIRDKFGNKIMMMDQFHAHWILALITDPSGPPPFVYRFVKNRWTNPQDILEDAPRVAQFLEMCPTAQLVLNDDSWVEIVIKTEADLVIARMTI
jgi:hypothetical protein